MKTIKLSLDEQYTYARSLVEWIVKNEYPQQKIAVDLVFMIGKKEFTLYIKYDLYVMNRQIRRKPVAQSYRVYG